MNPSILDLIWKMSLQTAIVAGVVWVICRLAPKAPASWRCALWVLVVVKLFIPPFAYLPTQLAFWQHPGPAYTQTIAAPEGSLSFAALRPTASHAALPAPTATAPMDATKALMFIWLGGALAMAGLTAMRFSRQRRLIADSTSPGDELTAMLSECAGRLGVHRLPRIRLSSGAQTPMLVGAIHPVILLPKEVLGSCGETNLSAMLLHELAHVKRRDMAILWLQQLAQTLFFFHPAVWLAGREMRRERELACDELVLSRAGIAPKDYAAGYVAALKLANGRPAAATSLAMAEPFDLEKRRLQGILGRPTPKLSAPWLMVLLALFVVCLPTFVACSKPDVAGAPRRVNAPTAQQDAEVMAGLTPVEGPGVVISLHDGPKSTSASPNVHGEFVVHDRDIREVVNALWATGAKAISINGQRLVASSSIRAIGPVVAVNSVAVPAPYVITAVGDPNALAALFQVKNPTVTITQQSSVTVPAYRPADDAGKRQPNIMVAARLHGQGIIVTLQDSPKLLTNTDPDVAGHYRIHDRDIREIVNELWAAGALAISVNDQRWVTNSSVSAPGSGMYINSVKLTSPFVITAIGKSETLYNALRLPGGPAEGLMRLGMIDIRQEPSVIVSAYDGGMRPSPVEAPPKESPEVAARRAYRASHLPWAVEESPERAMELIRKGADVNVTDEGGRTALHLAVVRNHYGLVKLLLEHGARVNVKEHSSDGCYNGWGWYPLHLALRNENKEIIRLLVAHGANVNAPRTDGWVPLHTAACHGQPDMVELLISRGAKLDTPNGEHSTPLRIAMIYGKVDAARVLIRRGANVNASTTAGETPLYEAAYRGYADTVRLLIAKGANVNARTKSGVSPLQVAVTGETAFVAGERQEFAKAAHDWDEVRRLLRKHGAKD